MLCLLALAVAGVSAVDDAIARSALRAEATALAAQPFERDPTSPVVVITGSSTVRYWRSHDRAFPGAQVVNTGFGGSTMDLLAEQYHGLIGRFSADQVFIGSGDNDLAQGRSIADIVADTAWLLERVATDTPEAAVAIVAAKPSLQRWHLRDRYEALNAEFRALAEERKHVRYVDVWHHLLDEGGRPRPELYAADGLHLNRQGYRVYGDVLATADTVSVRYRADAATGSEQDRS